MYILVKKHVSKIDLSYFQVYFMLVGKTDLSYFQVYFS